MADVKLLLKESIKNVGKVGDVVEVSAGYARNYLLPRDLAVEPTPNNVKKIEARRKEIEKQERERREQLAALIKTLEGVEVTLERRANEQGNLFGSVTATDIAKSLQGQGYNVNPDDVNLPGKLDRIDVYTVKIKFAEDLTTDLKVYVAPDPRARPRSMRPRSMSELIDSSTAQQFDRLPPHSIEAEMCLLASMMLDKELVGQVVQIVDREAFYPGRSSDHLRCAGQAVRAEPPDRSVILREELIKRQLASKKSAAPTSGADSQHRPLRRARRILRQHRPRKVDAAATDRREQ
jgi:large subunit ribosomal protein L9